MPEASPSPHLVRVHTAAACLAAVLATGPTSIAELAIIPPALAFLATPHLTFRTWKRIWRDPLGLALLAFSAWIAIGIAFTADKQQAVDEFGVLRFFPVVLLITPALHLSPNGRLRVIAALAIGVAIGQLFQLLHAWAALGGGPAVFDFGRARNRLSGYWDPAVAGTILTAALGLHLPAALMGSGRSRPIAIAAAAATVFALLATGSRGGWIASALLIALTACIAVIRAVRVGKHRKQTIAAVAAIAALTIAGAFVFRGTISARIDKAREDLAAARIGDYSKADAARLAMAGAAIDAFRAHPVRGVGTGNYGPWSRRNARIVRDPPSGMAESGQPPPIHDHAHNTPLHVAATNGVVGFTLLLAVAGAAVRQALAWVRRAPGVAATGPESGRGTGAGLGSYHAGPLVALLGLILITPFDTLHVSASSAAVTGIVLALCANPPRRASTDALSPTGTAPG